MKTSLVALIMKCLYRNIIASTLFFFIWWHFIVEQVYFLDVVEISVLRIVTYITVQLLRTLTLGSKHMSSKEELSQTVTIHIDGSCWTDRWRGDLSLYGDSWGMFVEICRFRDLTFSHDLTRHCQRNLRMRNFLAYDRSPNCN